VLVTALQRLRDDGRNARPELDPEDERLLEQARTRVEQRFAPRERLVETVAGGTFLIAAVAMATLLPLGRDIEVSAVIVLAIAYAVASRVKFEIGAGYTDATQLVLVPMLFVLPPEIVPLLVACGLLIGELPDYLTRSRHPERIVSSLANCWHAVGPALVFSLANVTGPRIEEWAIYLSALAAQFAMDVATASPRDWFTLRVPPSRHLALARWTIAVDALLAPVGLLAAFAVAESEYLTLLALPLMALLAMFARERKGRLDSALQLSDAYRGTTMVLADIVETDDAYTGIHSRTVVSLALATADQMGLDARGRRLTEFGALLHDVGKIAVPKEVINKPGPLTPDEWELIKVHTVDGERILARVGGFFEEVGLVVRSSHERWDGDGYPDGLSGEEIPIESRIVSCCDAFNAMTTDRPYRSALAPGAAIAELRKSAGSQFDPRVVEALLRVVERETPVPPREAASMLVSAGEAG
jgi:HD-GYP domain-containing protein (c-di-GMP phosphodiesterase class II)